MKKILIIAVLIGVLCGGVAAYAGTNVEKHTETTAITTTEKPTTTKKKTTTTTEKSTVTTEEQKKATTTEEAEVTTEEPTTTTEETDLDSEDVNDDEDTDEFENPYEYEDDSLEKCDHEWEKSIAYDPEQGYVWDKTCKKCHSVIYELATPEEYEQITGDK